MRGSPYGVDHLESDFDAVLGVARSRHRQAGDAVVAVAQDLDTHTVVLLKQQSQAVAR